MQKVAVMRVQQHRGRLVADKLFHVGFACPIRSNQASALVVRDLPQQVSENRSGPQEEADIAKTQGQYHAGSVQIRKPHSVAPAAFKS